MEVTFNAARFESYMSAGSGSHGIVQDMQRLCSYVEDHRVYLNIHPDWNMDTVSTPLYCNE